MSILSKHLGFASVFHPRHVARHALVALAFPLMMTAPSLPVRELPPGAKSHDMHLTYSRIEVNGASMVVRVRVFQDDLELALRHWSGHPEVVVRSSPAVDSLFADYWNATTRIKADDATVRGRVLNSGADSSDTEARLWWYEMKVVAPKPMRQLSVYIGLFFEQFRDQRNIVSLVRMPGGERESMYFAAGDKREVKVKW
jgi:hypothetical protein